MLLARIARSVRIARSALALAVGLALGLMAGPIGADAAKPADSTEVAAISAAADASRPFVVKVHADWCGVCTALNSTWSELGSQLGDGARLVIFDVTDRESLRTSQAEAHRLGLDAFFAEYKSRTGTIAVLRGDTRGKIEVMKGVRNVARYEAAVARARNVDPS